MRRKGKKKSIRILYVLRWLHLVKKTQVTREPPRKWPTITKRILGYLFGKEKKRRRRKRAGTDLLFLLVFTFLSFICRTTCAYWLWTLSAGGGTMAHKSDRIFSPCCFFFSFAPVKMQAGVYQQAERKWQKKKKKMFFCDRFVAIRAGGLYRSRNNISFRFCSTRLMFCPVCCCCCCCLLGRLPLKKKIINK